MRTSSLADGARNCKRHAGLILGGALIHFHPLLMLVIAGMTVLMSDLRAQQAKRIASAAQPRPAWTSSRIAGTPDAPAPFSVEVAFPNLKFTRPVLFSAIPGSNRLLVAELDGKIYTFENDPSVSERHLFFDLAKHVGGAPKIYGLAFHPNFKQNRSVYLCYVTKDEIPDGTRVSCFKVGDNRPAIDPTSEDIVMTWLSGGHNGGCLEFGNDGMLYIATGDATAPSPPDGLETGQDCSDLLSSILRIDVDHAGATTKYRVPPDNPFVGREGIRPEIWAYGFRNPWKFTFDRPTGDLWTGDVGWELWEMVYRVEKGGNYGWSVMEGRQTVRTESKRGPTPILPPVVDHPHTEAASITGGYVYHGKCLPELAGAYIYGDWVSGKIWALRWDGAKVASHQEIATTPVQIIAFGIDHAGELYVLDYERTGLIYRLVPNPGRDRPSAFPRKLSESGLFASTKDQTPSPGVVPFSVTAPLWSDHAVAKRWIAIPGKDHINVDDAGNMKFPAGTVLAKTLSLATKANDPKTARRLETQMLHFEGDTWRPYTFVWNEQQTDAELAPAAGIDLDLTVEDAAAPGGKRRQTWRVASRTECGMCHNTWAGSALAFNASQLNRTVGSKDAAENQVHRLVAQQVLSSKILDFLGKAPRLVDPSDSANGMEVRARSYLHANCAHCHRFGGGGTATVVLPIDITLDKTGLLGTRPTQGTFGLAGAKIVAPGDPHASAILFRMAKLGAGRMPRIGSSEVDVAAVALVEEWIKGLPSPTTDRSLADLAHSIDASLARLEGSAAGSEAEQTIDRLLSSSRGALGLEQFLSTRPATSALRQMAAERASKSPSSDVRDLFERFLPPDQRPRRLGSDIKAEQILALAGDAERGRAVFENSSAQCRNCHRIGTVGEKLGPDLNEIGKKYPRPALLQHILEPSREVAPEFVTYVVETTSGEVLTGLVVRRDHKEVVLKDGERMERVIAAVDIERIVPSAKSIMPDLLLKEMTAAQVADLLEYLSHLR